MPLYKIFTDKLIETVKRVQFDKEKDLQNLVETNIEKFFGLKFLETEYPIPNGRIDSLCIDEIGTPIVIEYKKKKDLSAIIQGLFYIDWLRNNRRTFEMIVREKIGNEMKVDWKTSPRLMIIAEEFDQKETSAINQINADVELIKYSFYGDLISFEQLTISKQPTSYSSNSTNSKEDVKPLNDNEINLENVLYKGSDKINEILSDLRESILNINDDIDERVKSSMIAYYSNGKGLIWIETFKTRFKIHLRKGDYSDKENLIKMDGWGGYPELIINEEQYNDKIGKYIKDIIMQACEN